MRHFDLPVQLLSIEYAVTSDRGSAVGEVRMEHHWNKFIVKVEWIM